MNRWPSWYPDSGPDVPIEVWIEAEEGWWDDGMLVLKWPGAAGRASAVVPPATLGQSP